MGLPDKVCWILDVLAKVSKAAYVFQSLMSRMSYAKRESSKGGACLPGLKTNGVLVSSRSTLRGVPLIYMEAERRCLRRDFSRGISQTPFRVRSFWPNVWLHRATCCIGSCAKTNSNGFQICVLLFWTELTVNPSNDCCLLTHALRYPWTSSASTPQNWLDTHCNLDRYCKDSLA